LALRDQVIRVSIAALLAVNVYFAAVEPCTSAEAVVYERYASHDLLDLWKSPLDPRLGLVYGVLARIATRLGGVSELTIRIPAILGGLLFWFGLWALCRRFRGWMAVGAFLVLAANPWTFRAFSTVNGAALAIGLLAMAARNLNIAGLLIGLAIGSDAAVAVPAMAIGVIAAAIVKINVWRLVDEVLLPALLAGSFLLLPALLIRQRPLAASAGDFGTRELMRTRLSQHHGTLRVSASPSVEPGLFFYRRRYHLDWIQIVPAGEDAEFFLLSAPDPMHGLRVLETIHGSILASQ
jgi:hypothetical protein